MFDSVLSYIESLIDIIQGIGELIVKYFTDLDVIFTTIGLVVVSIPSWVSWMPLGLIPIFVSALSIIVVYKFFGRT